MINQKIVCYNGHYLENGKSMCCSLKEQQLKDVLWSCCGHVGARQHTCMPASFKSGVARLHTPCVRSQVHLPSTAVQGWHGWPSMVTVSGMDQMECS